MVSCLQHYINNHLDKKVRKLFIFTDGCRGQNHNNTMVQYLHSLVINGRFEMVMHQLPTRGHSHLPCDRDFGVIERLQRKQDHVELYTGWNHIIKQRSALIEMNGSLIKTYKTGLSKYYRLNPKDWKITKYKQFCYNSLQDITVSEDMNGSVQKRFQLLKRWVSKLPYPSDPFYTTPCAVNPKKI